MAVDLAESHIDDVLTLADGRSLGWAEYGARDGEPLVFFHGLPGSRRFSKVLGPEAEALGLRLVAPERPGFGNSTFQEGRTFHSWADDVRALIDHLAIDAFYVAGISGGGPYALSVAAALGDRVNAAGVISGGGDMSTPETLAGMHPQNRAIFELAKSAGPAAVEGAMAPMIEMMRTNPAEAMQSTEGLPDADLEFIRRRPDVWRVVAEDAMEASKQGARGIGYEAWLFTQPWDFAPAEISVPVVLWHGDDDRNAPLAHAQEIARQVPNSQLVVWTGMGHLTAIDRVTEIFSGLVQAPTTRSRDR